MSSLSRMVASWNEISRPLSGRPVTLLTGGGFTNVCTRLHRYTSSGHTRTGGAMADGVGGGARSTGRPQVARVIQIWGRIRAWRPLRCVARYTGGVGLSSVEQGPPASSLCCLCDGIDVNASASWPLVLPAKLLLHHIALQGTRHSHAEAQRLVIMEGLRARPCLLRGRQCVVPGRVQSPTSRTAPQCPIHACAANTGQEPDCSSSGTSDAQAAAFGPLVAQRLGQALAATTAVYALMAAGAVAPAAADDRAWRPRRHYRRMDQHVSDAWAEELVQVGTPGWWWWEDWRLGSTRGSERGEGEAGRRR